MNDLKIPTPLPSVDLEATLAEAKLHWPKKQLPPLTEREVDALKSGAKIIPLTRGKWTIVDAEDYVNLSPFYWKADKSYKQFYASRTDWGSKQSSNVMMHRVILSVANHMFVDHRNSDGLDNRRFNIRLATRSQNGANIRITIANKSGLKGVHFDRVRRKYRARISVNGKYLSLGSSNDPMEMYERYKAAAAKYHGEFARF